MRSLFVLCIVCVIWHPEQDAEITLLHPRTGWTFTVIFFRIKRISIDFVNPFTCSHKRTHISTPTHLRAHTYTRFLDTNVPTGWNMKVNLKMGKSRGLAYWLLLTERVADRGKKVNGMEPGLFGDRRYVVDQCSVHFHDVQYPISVQLHRCACNLTKPSQALNFCVGMS